MRLFFHWANSWAGGCIPILGIAVYVVPVFRHVVPHVLVDG
jgi:hypothetical protein